MNKNIDYTNLKPTATIEDITKLCEEALKYNFASVCIHPYYIELAKEILKNSTVSVCTVVGFPLGMNSRETKVYEAIDAKEKGIDEIDMMINIGALKDKEYDYIKSEIEEIRDSIDGKILKVIIETGYLTEEEIIKMVQICNETFVNFIKTSTGFGIRGVNLEDIEIINKYKSDTLEIKASGGISDYETALNYIEKGVTRIGTSNGSKIMEDVK